MRHTPPDRNRPLSAILEELGACMEAYRISRAIKQADLAKEAGIARSTLARLEAGQGGTIDTLLRVLRALDIEERLLTLVPDARRSPLDPRSESGAPRQRVRSSKDASDDGDWSWDDDAS